MSQSLIAHAGVKAQVGAHLRTRHRVDAFGDFAVRIVQVAEEHRAVGAGFDAGGNLSFIDAMHAERAGFHAALAARHFRVLVVERLMNEGARLEGQAMTQ